MGESVTMSVEGAKNILWYWLSLLLEWGRLTITVTGKFVCM